MPILIELGLVILPPTLDLATLAADNQEPAAEEPAAGEPADPDDIVSAVVPHSRL